MTFDIAALNIIDFAALIILVISGILATLRGMTREIMGLAGWPISILVARQALHDRIRHGSTTGPINSTALKVAVVASISVQSSKKVFKIGLNIKTYIFDVEFLNFAGFILFDSNF